MVKVGLTLGCHWAGVYSVSGLSVKADVVRIFRSLGCERPENWDPYKSEEVIRNKLGGESLPCQAAASNKR